MHKSPVPPHRSLILALAFAGVLGGTARQPLRAQIPAEPIAIGFEPQFFVDDYLIDNHWPLKKGQRDANIVRVFHPPKRHSTSPVTKTNYRVDVGKPKPGVPLSVRIEGTAPGMIGMHMVVREGARLRMWYDCNTMLNREDRKSGFGWFQRVAYAESDNGLDWRFPALGFVELNGSKENNLVAPQRMHVPYLLANVPEKDRRGYKYIFLVLSSEKGLNGMVLVGSHDGLRLDWDRAVCIARIHSDSYNCMIYDESRGEYVMYLRAKDRYLANRHQLHAADLNQPDREQVELYEGESRRIARISSRELWTDWLAGGRIQNILLPDALDIADGFPRFYTMPTVRQAGIYWGYLARLRHDIGAMDVELVTSRDSFNFQRQTGRPRMLTVGPEGAWDDGLVFATPGWVEVGDEWWIYYRGDDEDHKDPPRNTASGLLRLRKEGFLSLHGPASGAVVATRELIWPGGALHVNSDARDGELKIMVTTGRREPVSGFGYGQCQSFRGDSVAQAIKWEGRSLDELKGRTIRLEFLLKNVHLYAFRAVPR